MILESLDNRGRGRTFVREMARDARERGRPDASTFADVCMAARRRRIFGRRRRRVQDEVGIDKGIEAALGGEFRHVSRCEKSVFLFLSLSSFVAIGRRLTGCRRHFCRRRRLSSLLPNDRSWNVVESCTSIFVDNFEEIKKGEKEEVKHTHVKSGTD